VCFAGVEIRDATHGGIASRASMLEWPIGSSSQWLLGIRVREHKSRDGAFCFEFDHKFSLGFATLRARHWYETNVIESFGENRRDEKAFVHHVIAQCQKVSA
jgi:hypothetical protein